MRMPMRNGSCGRSKKHAWTCSFRLGRGTSGARWRSTSITTTPNEITREHCGEGRLFLRQQRSEVREGCVREVTYLFSGLLCEEIALFQEPQTCRSKPFRRIDQTRSM